MYLVWALGWVFAAGSLWAQVPMDLNSPFNKTVLLSDRLGKVEEMEVLRGKISGNELEMVKPDGSLLLVSRGRVLGVLPKLPADGLAFTQQDAQKALALLRTAGRDWANRVETSGRTLAMWESLAQQASPWEQRENLQKKQQVRQWLEKVQVEDGGPRPPDLAEYLREGERLAQESGPDAGAIQQQMEKVKSLMAMNLGLIRQKSLPTEWSEVNPLLPVSLTAVLLLLFFWCWGNISNFIAALKSGTLRTSKKGGESRTVLNLRGPLYLVYAIFGAASIYLILQPRPVRTTEKCPENELREAEKAFYLGMNTFQRWSTQPKTGMEIGIGAWAQVLQSLLPAGEFRLNQFLTYTSPQLHKQDKDLLWRQGVKILFLQLQLDFLAELEGPTAGLQGLLIKQFWLGRVPLGGFLGQLTWNCFGSVSAEWDRFLGLASGTVWTFSGPDRLTIQVPQVLGKRDAKSIAELAGREKAKFKPTIGASELAQVFAEGDGDVYLNRTIRLTGRLKRVSSMRRLGNSMASEITRATLSKSGGAEAVAAVAPNSLEDEPDVFYLETSESGVQSKIQVKVLVKSPEVYYLDGRGDLYRSSANPNSDAPIVARQNLAVFPNGRVERIERDVIEVYGAEPPSEMPAN